MAASTACRGKISVTVKRGKRKVYAKNLKVSKKCAFRKKTTLKRSKVKKAKRLSMTLRFKGNSAIGAAKRTYKVKVK